MTKANQEIMWKKLLENGRTADAEAIDRVYNFSGTQKNVLEALAEEKNKKSK